MQPRTEQLESANDMERQTGESATGSAKPGLNPPQFRLSTMLTVTALVCFALALAKIIHPMLSGVMALGLFLVFAHIAGNVLGTQLKHSSRHAQPLEGRHQPSPACTEKRVAPATRLRYRAQLGWGTVIASSFGALVGGIGGGWLLWWSLNGDASIPSMALGVISCGVLGGFWGFGVSSLLGVLGGAVWHAQRDPDER